MEARPGVLRLSLRPEREGPEARHIRPATPGAEVVPAPRDASCRPVSASPRSPLPRRRDRAGRRHGPDGAGAAGHHAPPRQRPSLHGRRLLLGRLHQPLGRLDDPPAGNARLPAGARRPAGGMRTAAVDLAGRAADPRRRVARLPDPRAGAAFRDRDRALASTRASPGAVRRGDEGHRLPAA